jgi:predicted DNA-binding ribbon-helix-helix protein
MNHCFVVVKRVPPAPVSPLPRSILADSGALFKRGLVFHKVIHRLVPENLQNRLSTRIVARMPSAGIVKRSVRIAGHVTSVSLEAAFWQGLRDIAASRGVSINALIAAIDTARSGNLSSAIRLFVLDGARNGELTPPASDAKLPRPGTGDVR